MTTTAPASKIGRGAALAALLALSACMAPPPSTVRDTGNMAYPAPLPQGNINSAPVAARIPDTGNMAYPAPLPQGNVSTTIVPASSRRPDTGAVAYPAPVLPGQIGTTTLSR